MKKHNSNMIQKTYHSVEGLEAVANAAVVGEMISESSREKSREYAARSRSESSTGVGFRVPPRIVNLQYALRWNTNLSG